MAWDINLPTKLTRVLDMTNKQCCEIFNSFTLPWDTLPSHIGFVARLLSRTEYKQSVGQCLIYYLWHSSCRGSAASATTKGLFGLYLTQLEWRWHLQRFWCRSHCALLGDDVKSPSVCRVGQQAPGSWCQEFRTEEQISTLSKPIYHCILGCLCHKSSTTHSAIHITLVE